MRRFSRRLVWAAVAGLVVVIAAVSLPALVRAYWSARASNPVRRGVRLARDLGCFSCHGPTGGGGLADPTATIGQVPSWSGGTWMMYVNSDEQIRQFILDGVSHARRESAAASTERERMTIRMPAYRGWVGSRDVDDLVAAFKVLSRMSAPAEGSLARRGLELVEHWGCAACHGPAGSGGLPNPGSFAGFVPGWYGADFEDLVRDRAEFDAWIREGSIARLDDRPIAAWFMRRQRIRMPAYRSFTPEQLDALWAYFDWLGQTGGGHS